MKPPSTLATLQHKILMILTKTEPVVQFDADVDVTPDDGEPLLFLNNVPEGVITVITLLHEVVATVHVAVPEAVHITNTEYSSLCHASRHIVWKGNE